MTGEITTYEGKRYTLPEALSWKFEYACGVPCDSFFVELPWRAGEEEIYRKAVRFTAREEGKTVFTGVVDEAEWSLNRKGSRVTLSGRSMAALLLDNEAQAADYAAATLEDILRDHVAPYGIQTGEKAALPACQNFSVAAGSSEWQMLYDFVRYHGGVPPRFDREGRLVLVPFSNDGEKILDDTVPLTAYTGRERRYGVLSSILVRDKKRCQAEEVVNQEFRDQGGQARRVLTMSGSPGERAMRYSGQFQLDKSAAGRRRVELTVPALFFAWPGELIRISRTGCGENGLWRVLESAVEENARGRSTSLVLAQPDVVI